MDITYTALREIAAGHSSESVYQNTIGCAGFSEAINADRKTSYSLDRSNYESVSYGHQNTIKIQTSAIKAIDLPEWREFAASVLGGEEFTIDASDIGNAPNYPFTCFIKKGITGPTRIGQTNYFKYSFEVVKV